MIGSSADEHWSRLLAWLRLQQEELREAVMGGLPEPEYRDKCGRHAMIEETLIKAREIRRDEDIHREAPEPFRSVEE